MSRLKDEEICPEETDLCGQGLSLFHGGKVVRGNAQTTSPASGQSLYRLPPSG